MYIAICVNRSTFRISSTRAREPCNSSVPGWYDTPVWVEDDGILDSFVRREERLLHLGRLFFLACELLRLLPARQAKGDVRVVAIQDPQAFPRTFAEHHFSEMQIRGHIKGKGTGGAEACERNGERVLAHNMLLHLCLRRGGTRVED